MYRTLIDDIPEKPLTDKCLILDFDETLVSSNEDLESFLKILKDPKYSHIRERSYHIVLEDHEKPGEGSKFDYWGVTRPGLSDFLVFAFSYFKVVAVWSAGCRRYVEEISDHLTKDLPNFHIIYTHDDVHISENGDIHKPIIKMIKNNPIMTMQNTFIIDDNEGTTIFNKKNAIIIPKYEPNLNELDKPDNALNTLKEWFLTENVMNCTDITTLNKNIFPSIKRKK